MSVFDIIDRIQELSPCAAVRYRIKRILGQEIDLELFDEFYNSKWVEMLKENQLDDGSYGRFHSRNSKIKQRFPTTELAIDSMKMLDIKRGNPLVDKLCDFMEKILKHEIEWPDGFEEELSSLRAKRDQDGFWNFGKGFSCQKLSDDWRSKDKMNIDHTIMALLLFNSK